MSKFGRKATTPPAGFEVIEPVLNALDMELRDRVNEPHEGLRKNESQWPIHQINWQRSRYVFDMYYTYARISREVYDYCIKQRLVDAALIAKWKKPGYERLCSTAVIDPRNYKFGTVSICRVPKKSLPPGTVIEDPTTGCHGCASGSNHNIFGNKYGQYLAAIQIAREERQAQKLERKRLQEIAKRQAAVAEGEKETVKEDTTERIASDDEDERDKSNSDEGYVVDATGKQNKKDARGKMWANEDEEEVVLDGSMIGTEENSHGMPPAKRSRC